MKKDNKQLLEKIKNSFKEWMKFEDVTEATVTKFSNIEVEDGTKLAIDEGAKLAVDTPIFKLDDKGNKTPCDDGTYKLKTGETITVKDNKIVDVKEKEAEATEEKTEVKEEKMADASVEACMAEIEALKQQIAQILEILNGLGDFTKQEMKQVEEKFKKLSEEPVTESIKFRKVNIADFKTKTIDKDLESLREVRTKYKF